MFRGFHPLCLEGVVLVDAEYVKGRKVFIHLLCAFRHGRDGDEFHGIDWHRDLFLNTKQVYPPSGSLVESASHSKISRLQERLIRKLGPDSYPFTFKVDLSLSLKFNEVFFFYLYLVASLALDTQVITEWHAVLSVILGLRTFCTHDPSLSRIPILINRNKLLRLSNWSFLVAFIAHSMMWTKQFLFNLVSRRYFTYVILCQFQSWHFALPCTHLSHLYFDFRYRFYYNSLYNKQVLLFALVQLTIIRPWHLLRKWRVLIASHLG